MLAGGCDAPASHKALDIEEAAQVKKVIADSNQPVLLMFYKQGCASCAALEPIIDRLATEYEGRAVVAKFMILNVGFGVKSRELKDRYNVVFVPHVILTVGGQEKQHWISDYNTDDYRKAINGALGKVGP
jgi:thioredoxin-like negative regulator of GroEL